jgi:hypothetical protein
MDGGGGEVDGFLQFVGHWGGGGYDRSIQT